MSTFKHNRLTIDLNITGDTTKMTWRGYCDVQNPADALTPYLNQVIQDTTSSNFIVKYSPLLFMNSSSVRTIIEFITNLNARKISTLITYDGNSTWQRIAFGALVTFCRRMEYVTIEQQ